MAKKTAARVVPRKSPAKKTMAKGKAAARTPARKNARPQAGRGRSAAGARSASTTAGKYVYLFGRKTDGNGTMKPLLGGKGANLAEMCRIGLPVPP